jgi:hypothetical protein
LYGKPRRGAQRHPNPKPPLAELAFLELRK